MTDYLVLRQFNPVYIYLDIAFLLVFLGLLVWRKKYTTIIVGLLMGLLYMAVDYGIFHLLTDSRSITEGYSLFWVLLWMSVSYGFTNFAWIWLWIRKDHHLMEWSLLILMWWFCCPMLASWLGAGLEPIVISRTTGAYHGAMALIMVVGYALLIVYNLRQAVPQKRINLPWLLIIGVLVQFGWELGLLLGGIRSAGMGMVEKLSPLVINSLLETNLGMPIIYFIFLGVTSKFTEDLKRRKTPLTLSERIEENNAEKVREEKISH